MCLEGLFKCLHRDERRESKCVFGTTRFPYKTPQKIKIAAVKHRFGCKLGLCSTSHLATYYFKDRLGYYVDHRYTWLSYKTLINRDRVIRHMFDDTAKITITFRADKKKLILYMPVKQFLKELRPEDELLVFRLEHGAQPQPLTGIVEVCEEDTLINLKEGDVFLSQLGHEEYTETEVEIVPTTDECDVTFVTETEFKEILMSSNREKRTDKECSYQEEEEEEEKQETDQKIDSSSEDCTDLEGKKMCQEQDAAEADNTEKERNGMTPAAVINTRSTRHTLSELKQRLLCLVGVVLLLVMVLAALEPYVSEKG